MKRIDISFLRLFRLVKNLTLCTCIVITFVGTYLYFDYVKCEQFKDTFLYLYPFGNVSSIVQELKKTGTTHTKEINDVYRLYNIINSPKNACKKPVSLLVIVKSKCSNHGQRSAIRNTWGKGGNPNIYVYFSLGYEAEVQDEINKEIHAHNDIIQGSFDDVYRNNIYKTSLNIRWVSVYCSHLQYVLFIDDDYLLNVKGILSYVRMLTSLNISNKMYGYRGQCWKPIRLCFHEKSYISLEEYRYDYWPDYLLGGTILTTMDVVIRISSAIPYIKRISIDDTYVGIAAHLLGIELIDEKRFSKQSRSASQMKYLLSAHGYDEESLIATWEEFTKF
ncbi:BRN [Mytilus edulis]|uniref:Hexosyltransferase n=1 Tax=Mytilus edulis TaxID=6550 RepID=A0A8S3T0H1_MYTED|nr:BRN [Mytilus edulis]